MPASPDPAFVSLLRAQQEPLLRAARLLTGDWVEAEDLLRDTFAWAFGSWLSLAESGTAALGVRQRLVSVYLAEVAAAEQEQGGEVGEYDDDDDDPEADDPDFDDPDFDDPDFDDPGVDEAGEQPGAGEMPTGATARAEESSAVQEPPESPSLVAGLRVLSPEDRSVVVSRYYLGLSASEIGEILDIDAEDVDAIAVSVLAALRRGQVGVGGSG